MTSKRYSKEYFWSQTGYATDILPVHGCDCLWIASKSYHEWLEFRSTVKFGYMENNALTKGERAPKGGGMALYPTTRSEFWLNTHQETKFSDCRGVEVLTAWLLIKISLISRHCTSNKHSDWTELNTVRFWQLNKVHFDHFHLSLS